MNNILKNYNPTASITPKNANYNYFHMVALFHMISGGRIEGSVIITNKRIIMEYKTKTGQKKREEYTNEN